MVHAPTPRYPRHVLAEVDSTSAYLRRLAAAGAPIGTAVFAKCQTGGYGQRGRVWRSPAGEGLYLSVLAAVPENPTHLPFIVGLACHDAVAAYSDEVGLKWVNDLVARGRKLGGILVEVSRRESLGKRESVAIVGIGINTLPQADQAGGLTEASVVAAIGLAELCAATATMPEALELGDRVLERLAARLAQYDSVGFGPIQAAWSDASFTLGRTVRLVDDAQSVCGTAEAIGPDGELLVRDAEGQLIPIIGGTLRAADGAYY